MGVVLPFGKKTLIMGIINVTPDSFYPGSRSRDAGAAVHRALRFVEEGADILDIGGESTRPGAAPVSVQEEIRRVIPVMEEIRKRSAVHLSVDTSKAPVARAAVERGAEIINDVSGLRSPNWGELAEVAARAGTYLILMHMRGVPATMQEHALYTDVVAEVSSELDRSIERALRSGIRKERIILDPGIGFSKLAEHNLAILKRLPELRGKGFPLLIGLSRKSFLGAYSGPDPANRLLSTIAAHAIAVFQGVDVIRVHDVKEAVETVRLVDDIKNAS